MIYQGAGGLGAVSFGFSEILVELLLVAVLMLLVNFAMRGVARRRGSSAQRFRRVHLIVTLVFVPVFILFEFAFVIAFRDDVNALMTVLTLLSLLWWTFLAFQAVFVVWAVRCLLSRPSSTT